MSKITNFFGEVGSEMRKTSWPKSKELTKYTVVVFNCYFMCVILYGSGFRCFRGITLVLRTIKIVYLMK